jgi:hypothetical protein
VPDSHFHKDTLTLSKMPTTIYTAVQRKQYLSHFEKFDEWTFPATKQGIFWADMTKKQQTMDNTLADLQKGMVRTFHPFLNVYNDLMHEEPQGTS